MGKFDPSPVMGIGAKKEHIQIEKKKKVLRDKEKEFFLYLFNLFIFWIKGGDRNARKCAHFASLSLI